MNVNAVEPRQLEVLLCIVFLSLGVIVAFVVALLRSGRVVPLPGLQVRRRTESASDRR